MKMAMDYIHKVKKIKAWLYSKIQAHLANKEEDQERTKIVGISRELSDKVNWYLLL